MDRDTDLVTDPSTPLIVALKGDPAFASPVPRLDLDLSKFHNGRWALQLDTAMTRRQEPIVILAQGAACLAVAWWAQLSPRSYTVNIRGAVFLSPLSFGPGQAAVARQVRASPATRLPFASIVASDPTPMVEQVLALADGWGSCFVDSSAPAASRQSNRQGGWAAVHERLVDLLGYLGGANHAAPSLVAESDPVVRLHGR